LSENSALQQQRDYPWRCPWTLASYLLEGVGPQMKMLPKLLLVLLMMLRVWVQGCPAGFLCPNPGEEELCPSGTFSMQGWTGCCSETAAVCEAGSSLNSNCTCSALSCPLLELQRGRTGEIVCRPQPPGCKHPCPIPGLFREQHTCTCLRVSSSQLGLWGNPGGPYLEGSTVN
jgi:hypothetical protein